MSNQKPQIKLDIITTADGSPTVTINGGEKMHSMDGAFAESLYIYGPCIENSLSQEKPAILSMGLGLGYNELLSLGYLLKLKKKDFFILSYEKEDWLIRHFLSFLKSNSKNQCFKNPSIKLLNKSFALETHSNSITEMNFDSIIKMEQDITSVTDHFIDIEKKLFQCYKDIVQLISDALTIDKNELIEFAVDAINKNTFQIAGPLKVENPYDFKFNSILYDAFSGQSDKDLWSLEHLASFIKNYCHESDCFFSTYAATGNLKRGLRSENFEIIMKKGFGKKRESTFAYRKRN